MWERGRMRALALTIQLFDPSRGYDSHELGICSTTPCFERVKRSSVFAVVAREEGMKGRAHHRAVLMMRPTPKNCITMKEKIVSRVFAIPWCAYRTDQRIAATARRIEDRSQSCSKETTLPTNSNVPRRESEIRRRTAGSSRAQVFFVSARVRDISKIASMMRDECTHVCDSRRFDTCESRQK